MCCAKEPLGNLLASTRSTGKVQIQALQQALRFDFSGFKDGHIHLLSKIKAKVFGSSQQTAVEIS